MKAWSRSIAILSVLVLAVIASVQQSHAQTVDGFRNLKFGMTADEVTTVLKKDCKSVSVHPAMWEGECYAVGGQKRSIEWGTDNAGKLNQIQLDMGAMSRTLFTQIDHALHTRYKRKYILGPGGNILKNPKHPLVERVFYADGQVILVVLKSKFIFINYVDSKGAEAILKRRGLGAKVNPSDF